MRKYPGLIPGPQTLIGFQKPYWQYGNIINGQKQIDTVLHFGCFVLGFNRWDIVDYVSNNMKTKPEVAESFIMEDNLRLNDVSWTLAEKLYTMSGYKSIFALSGSDANEGAIKLASAYQKQLGQDKRQKIVCFENSYHGSTFLNYSMGDSLFEDPFYTLKRYDQVIRLKRDFEVKDTNWDEVMCVMVETCSYGHGLAPNTDEFWGKIAQLQEQGVIVIVDDIFMGGGKTGTFVGWKNLPVTPDIFTMGKAITGGYYPLSITLYGPKVDEVLPEDFNWEHGFTYNYSLPGILACKRYLDILQDERPLDEHRKIVTRARTIFVEAGYKIKGEFGTIFDLERGDESKFFIIPISADNEYFSVLKDQIK